MVSSSKKIQVKNEQRIANGRHKTGHRKVNGCFCAAAAGCTHAFHTSKIHKRKNLRSSFRGICKQTLQIGAREMQSRIKRTTTAHTALEIRHQTGPEFVRFFWQSDRIDRKRARTLAYSM